MINHNKGTALPVKPFKFAGLVKKNGAVLVAFESAFVSDLDGVAAIKRVELRPDEIAEYIRREYKSMLFWAEKGKSLKKGHPQQPIFKKVADALKDNIEEFTAGKKAFDDAAMV